MEEQTRVKRIVRDTALVHHLGIDFKLKVKCDSSVRVRVKVHILELELELVAALLDWAGPGQISRQLDELV